MSYIEYRSSIACYLNGKKSDVGLAFSHKKGWLPGRSCVKWTPGLQVKLIDFLFSIDYPYRKVSYFPFEDINLISEIRKFLISLDAYIESYKPVIPIRDLLVGVAQKDFATTLKRIRWKSIVESWGADIFSTPEWYNDVKHFFIEDVGQIFNYAYLIYWEVDEPDDYKYGDIPLKQDSSMLEKFRLSVRSILPDTQIKKVERDEILLIQSNSISLSEESKVFHFRGKHKNLRFSHYRSPCNRSVIRVSPANERDSVILEINDLNRVTWIDQQAREVLEEMEGHIHLRSEEEIQRRIKNLSDNYNKQYFLHRDIQKEGITKPRNLLQIILEELHAKYPYLDAFESTDFYGNFKVRMADNSLFEPIRGHGLGMANALTTIMQIAVHNLILKESGETEDIIEGKCDSLYLNDDSVVALESEEDAEAYWNIEDVVLAGLGLIREPRKSFLSHGRFVIAERYYDAYRKKFLSKEHYLRREILLILTAANVVQAKAMFSSLCQFVQNDLIERYKEEIYSFWGYEFFPEEIDYPTIVGGWQNENLFGVSLALQRLDELDYNQRVLAAYEANKILDIRFRPKIFHKRKKLPPLISKLYPGIKIPDHLKKQFNADDLFETRMLKFEALDSEDVMRYWEELKTARRDRYLAITRGCMSKTYDSLIKEILDDHPFLDFLPPHDMIEGKEDFNTSTDPLKDYYVDSNAKTAALNKFYPVGYRFKEEYSLQSGLSTQIGIKSSTEYIKLLEKTIKKRVDVSRKEEIDGIPRLKNHFMNEYLMTKVNNIDAYLCACFYVNPFALIPIPTYSRIKALELRKEVFGVLLTYEEVRSLSNTDITRETLYDVLKLRERIGSTDPIHIFINSVISIFDDNYRKEPERPPIRDESDIEDDTEKVDVDFYRSQFTDLLSLISFRRKYDEKEIQQPEEYVEEFNSTSPEVELEPEPAEAEEGEEEEEAVYGDEPEDEAYYEEEEAYPEEEEADPFEALGDNYEEYNNRPEEKNVNEVFELDDLNDIIIPNRDPTEEDISIFFKHGHGSSIMDGPYSKNKVWKEMSEICSHYAKITMSVDRDAVSKYTTDAIRARLKSLGSEGEIALSNRFLESFEKHILQLTDSGEDECLFPF